MFSLQSFLKKNDKFHTLLEQNAKQVHQGALALHVLMTRADDQIPAKQTFTNAIKRGKELATQVREELLNTFITTLDRQDIEAINTALNEVTTETQYFDECYEKAAARLQQVDFSRHTQLLERASSLIINMVSELSHGLRIVPMNKLQTSMQLLETEGDRLSCQAMYVDGYNTQRELLAHDLFKRLEKALDKCHEVSRIIYSIVLKHS